MSDVHEMQAAMRKKAEANRRAPVAKSFTPMKTWGKAFWKKVFEKRDEDGFSDITLDELAEVCAHDEEALVSAHADSKGNIRTVLRHLLFHLRFALLFAREERKKLEKRVRELETSVPSYRGSWKQRTPYARGSIVA